MNIVYVAITLICLNWFLMATYCRIERYIDNKKFMREAQERPNTNEIVIKESNIKKIYHWLNAYLYGWVRYNTLLAGYVPSYRFRRLLYRYVFAMRLTRQTVIFGGCEFRSPWNITIGRSVISANCILDGRGKIHIDDDVVFGSGVHVWTEEHGVNDPLFRVLKSNIAEVVIKRHAWICSDTTILPGVTVNEGAVLAARACAVKDCEEFGVYTGIPAKKIANRNHDLKYILNGKPSWHFF